jgi:hypothetical protein
MSQNLNSAVSVIGIDIDKNSFHVGAAGVAVGRNALRGSGPNCKHAFKDAMTQKTGSPDPLWQLGDIAGDPSRQTAGIE